MFVISTLLHEILHPEGRKAALEEYREIEAEIVYWQRLAEATKDPDMYHKLGVSLSDARRTDEAMAAWEEALRLDPEHLDSLFSLGNKYDDQGRYTEALELFQRIARINPRSSTFRDFHLYIGLTLLKLNRKTEALQELLEAIRLVAPSAHQHTTIGTLYLDEGKVDEAIYHFQQAIGLSPIWYEAHLNLGNAYYQQGRVAEARVEWQKVLEITPEGEDANKAKEKLEQTKLNM